MGWLTMGRTEMGIHRTPKAYLDAQFTYARDLEDGTLKGLRVIRSAYVGRTYYAACAPFTRDGGKEAIGDVFAVVCLTRWAPKARDGQIFGYKDMTEHSGPTDCRCPQAVLSLLGPTMDHYALDWRHRCLVTLDRRKRTLCDGDRIKLASPLRFTDGHEGDVFTVRRTGRSLTLIAPHGGRYRVARFHERDWSIVPTTKIHPAVFAERI